MTRLNDFLNESTTESATIDENVEIIEQMRPCSKCDLYVDQYSFNKQTMEMFWTCKDGHDTKYVVG